MHSRTYTNPLSFMASIEQFHWYRFLHVKPVVGIKSALLDWTLCLINLGPMVLLLQTLIALLLFHDLLCLCLLDRLISRENLGTDIGLLCCTLG